MSWEAIERTGPIVGRGESIYGPKWQELPAVSVRQDGLTLNGVFMDQFVNGHDGMLALVDIEGGKLGLRPTSGSPAAYKTNRNTHSKCATVGTKQLAKRFASHRGKAYRAKLNRIENLVEVDLSPENQLA